ncbi:hypothetical protein ALMP_84270 [Streptomyces sp. A012304]|nr:hypothetical protein ALMP_84270 [Streptomyces sp. A012304]
MDNPVHGTESASPYLVAYVRAREGNVAGPKQGPHAGEEAGSFGRQQVADGNAQI